MLQDKLDSKEIDFDYFYMDLSRFQDDFTSIEKEGFADLFRQGHTMVLLNPEDFDFVDKWFNDNKNVSEELVVRILDDKGNQKEIIQHVDLCY